MSNHTARTDDPSDPAALVTDCTQCIGLCCVAPGFDASEDFAFAKPALAPCRHLAPSNMCRIHEDLDEKGFSGCARFECKGAGPYVVQHMFPRKSWRKDRQRLEDMAESYRRMRAVSDMVELLVLAKMLPLSGDQETARQQMLASLLPDPAWTHDALAEAEAAGLITKARATLASFRDAATQR